jgi:hypothetical protein
MISRRDVKERILLGLRYRVVDWVREGYVTIIQRPTIQHKELRRTPFPISWATIAGILAIRDSIADKDDYRCCDDRHGRQYTTRHCHCRALAAVNKEFDEELREVEDLPSFFTPPLPTAEPTSLFDSTGFFGPGVPVYNVGSKKKKKRGGAVQCLSGGTS